MVILSDRDILSAMRAMYLVIHRKAIYADEFTDEISSNTLDARTWIVRQSVHLLPRSVIYFEDFLSPCISHHYASLRIVRGLATGIFFSYVGQNTRREIFSYTTMHQFEDATLWGSGGASGAGTEEENKRAQLRGWSLLRFDTIVDLR